MRSSISIPVSLSSSYLHLLPFSISITATKSSGFMRLGLILCQMFNFFLPFLTCKALVTENDLVVFYSHNLINSGLVSSALKLGVNKEINKLKCGAYTDNSAAKAKNVGVVVKAGVFG